MWWRRVEDPQSTASAFHEHHLAEAACRSLLMLLALQLKQKQKEKDTVVAPYSSDPTAGRSSAPLWSQLMEVSMR